MSQLKASGEDSDLEREEQESSFMKSRVSDAKAPLAGMDAAGSDAGIPEP